jgi:hypothetical protein
VSRPNIFSKPRKSPCRVPHLGRVFVSAARVGWRALEYSSRPHFRESEAKGEPLGRRFDQDRSPGAERITLRICTRLPRLCPPHVAPPPSRRIDFSPEILLSGSRCRTSPPNLSPFGARSDNFAQQNSSRTQQSSDYVVVLKGHGFSRAIKLPESSGFRWDETAGLAKQL